MNEQLSDWPTSTFDERYRCAYAPALAFSNAITHDWERSEEVVQDAFILLHNEIENGANMSCAWFFAIVRNKSLDARRAQMSRRKIGTPACEFDRVNDDGKLVPFLENEEDRTTLRPDQAARRDDTVALFAKMRGSLSEEQREIFDLANDAVFQTEAAERLGISENAFKMRWRNIRTILRDRFRTHYTAL